jgi:4-hydroxy-tetrahydrodipicolinate synthase
LILDGIIPALLTPMTASGSIDENGLRQLLRYQLDAGVAGVFVLGSSGEFAFLSSAEQEAVVNIAVDEIAGAVPLLAGASAASSRAALERVQRYSSLGISGAVVLPPFYHTCTSAELIRHFQLIVSEGGAPIVLYNNPQSTGSTIGVDVIRELAGDPRVIGVKDSSGDFVSFCKLLTEFSERMDFAVVQGDERYAAATFLLGGRVGQFGLANVAPRLMLNIVESARLGQIVHALALQAQADTLASMWDIRGGGESSYVASMKCALELLGLCGRSVAFPYLEFGASDVEEVRRVMVTAGVLDQASEVAEVEGM